MAVTVQDLVNEAVKHIGARYTNGGGRTWGANVALPPSFDCSGFIKYLGLRTGAGDPGNTSDTQYAAAQRAGLTISNMDIARFTPGVLLFKPGQGNNGHVAMVYNTQGDTIEATGSGGGVKIIKGGAKKNYFTRAAYMPGVNYTGASSVTGTMANGVTNIPDSSIAPTGSNNLASDPAWHLAAVAALLAGQTPEQVTALGQSMGAYTDQPTDPAADPAAAAGTTNAQGIVVSGTGTPDRQQWAKDFLSAGGFPTTESNIRAVVAWQGAENTKAGNNPLATTQKAPGSTNFNSNGGYPVQNFADYHQGIVSTLQTVNNGRYGDLVNALRAGNDAQAVANGAAKNGTWGTEAFQVGD